MCDAGALESAGGTGNYEPAYEEYENEDVSLAVETVVDSTAPVVTVKLGMVRFALLCSLQLHTHQ